MLQEGSRVEFVHYRTGKTHRGTIASITRNADINAASWLEALVRCDDGDTRFPRLSELREIGVLDKIAEALEAESAAN